MNETSRVEEVLAAAASGADDGESKPAVPLSRVLRYLLPYRRLAIISIGSTLMVTLAGLLAPWPLKILIDSALGDVPLGPVLTTVLGAADQNRVGVLLFAVSAAFAVTLAHNGLAVLDDYVNTKLKLNMTLDFRGDLFEHAQRLSLAFHDRRDSGNLLYVINFLADAPAALVMSIPGLGQSALTLVGMLWISFLIDAELALLSLAIVPLLYYSIGYYITHIQERLYKVKGMEGETLSIIHEAMAMIRVVAAFAREKHEQRRFREQGERAINARIDLTVRQTLFSLVVNATTAIGSALVLGVGAYHVLQGELTVGQLLVVVAYIASVYAPLKTISTTVGSLQDQLVSMQIAFRLLDIAPQVRDEEGAVDVERTEGRVTFEHVDFSYDQRVSVLKDIDFDVRPGQVVAFVGPTGAGKTTVMSLIPRFYDPSRGRVLLNGVDVRTLTLRSLRQQTSIVLQEPLLFAASVADNIRYGRLDATMDDVIEAAKAANAHDFIEHMPDGYDSNVGESGAGLSGGERQRIAMARAFLKDAPILILDEPTSSIDLQTEAAILDALQRLMEGRTTFVVAHRLSTIRKADMIFVVDEGEIVERGSHSELLRLGGLYRHLHDMQAADAEGDSPGAAARAPLDDATGAA